MRAVQAHRRECRTRRGAIARVRAHGRRLPQPLSCRFGDREADGVGRHQSAAEVTPHLRLETISSALEATEWLAHAADGARAREGVNAALQYQFKPPRRSTGCLRRWRRPAACGCAALVMRQGASAAGSAPMGAIGVDPAQGAQPGSSGFPSLGGGAVSIIEARAFLSRRPIRTRSRRARRVGDLAASDRTERRLVRAKQGEAANRLSNGLNACRIFMGSVPRR